MKSKLSEQLKAGTTVTVDFNPVADRLRVITSDGMNLRVNVDDGKATVDGALKFKDGDVNAGKTPNVIAGAYSNSFKGTKATALYDIDASGALLSQAQGPCCYVQLRSALPFLPPVRAASARRHRARMIRAASSRLRCVSRATIAASFLRPNCVPWPFISTLPQAAGASHRQFFANVDSLQNCLASVAHRSDECDHRKPQEKENPYENVHHRRTEQHHSVCHPRGGRRYNYNPVRYFC